jgi:hypothetical protein
MPLSSDLSASRRTATAVVYVVLAIAAYVLTTRGLARLMPRHVPAVDVKREYFAAHKDEYTTVFLGTSMIHRHIVPEVLDAEFLAHGVDERSFNFGVARMTFSEASVLLDWIFESRPAKLRRVVIDAHLFTTSGAQNQFSARHIWWHTPEQTYLVAADLLVGKKPWSERWDVLQVELKALLINLTATGRAAEEFRVAWEPDYIEPNVDDVPITAEGFRAIEELKDDLHIKRRKDFVAKAKKYAAELVRRGKKRRKLGTFEAAMLGRLIAKVEVAGLEVVILEAPAYEAPFTFPGSDRPIHVISFNDPERYPELFGPELRHDHGHLNAKGARVLSRALAEQLAPSP